MIIKKLIKIKITKYIIIVSHLKKKLINKEFIQKLRINKNILNKKFTIEDQKKYINSINISEKDLILSVKLNSKFIGTIGLQNLNKKFCHIGVFIFSESALKKKISKYFLIAAILLVNFFFKKEFFMAGINNDNLPSIKSFSSVGFSKIKNSELKKYVSVQDYKSWLTRSYKNYSCYKLDIKDLKNILRYSKLRYEYV